MIVPLKNMYKRMVLFEPIAIILLSLLSSLDYSLTYENSWLKASVIFQLVFFIYIILTSQINESNPFPFFSTSVRVIFAFFALSSGAIGQKFVDIMYHGGTVTTLAKLETICEMIIIPLITGIWAIFLLRQQWRKILQFKRTLVIITYLFIWIWFGCFYFFQAEQGFSNSFTFSSNQAEVETTTNGIMNQLGYPESQKNVIHNILENGDYNLDTWAMSNGEFFTSKQIRDNWGQFYENKLSSDGYSAFTMHVLKNHFELKPIMLDDYDLLRTMANVINKPFVQVQINVYKGILHIPGSVMYIDPHELSKQEINGPSRKYLLLFNPTDFANFSQIFFTSPDQHLSNLLSFSHTLLGSQFLNISIGLGNQDHKDYIFYDISNFMYFSAMTITTVGFGDITPNTTMIRTAVMVEALLGIVVMGLYISFLTQNRSDT